LAGAVHCFDVALETSRRGACAQLPKAVDVHVDRAGGIWDSTINVADIAAVFCIPTRNECSDTNKVTRRGDIPAGCPPYTYIFVATTGSQCPMAYGCILETGNICSKRVHADCRIVVPVSVGVKCLIPKCRVANTAAIRR